jgi:hypothetical protein
MPVQYTDEILNTTTGLFARGPSSRTRWRISACGAFRRSYKRVMIDGQPLNDGYNNGVQWPHHLKRQYRTDRGCARPVLKPVRPERAGRCR